MAGCILSMLASTVVDARPAICAKLESQLTRSSGGGNAAARKYDQAAKKQLAALKRTERMARAQGCSIGLSFFQSGDCASLTRTIRQMRGNLANLERQRDSLGSAVSRGERRRILASLRQYGCTDDDGLGIVRRGTEEVRILGGRKSDAKRIILRDVRPKREEEPARNTAYSGSFSGQYRTLCVRSCDGYYFPISYSSTASDFPRDESACRQLCPGTDVALYVHEVPGQESEDMVSLDGVPYASMPSAFRYRTEGVSNAPQCSCRPVGGFASYGVPQSLPETVGSVPEMPVPTARPDPYADKETLANAAGGLTLDALRSIVQGRVVGAEQAGAAGREIRVVGPAFYPDPEAAIDLQVQGPYLLP